MSEVQVGLKRMAPFGGIAGFSVPFNLEVNLDTGKKCALFQQVPTI